MLDNDGFRLYVAVAGHAAEPGLDRLREQSDGGQQQKPDANDNDS